MTNKIKPILIFTALHLILTLVFAQLVGPAGWKLEEYFGLVGWAGTAPRYILHLYIAPIVFLVFRIRPQLLYGALCGLIMVIPLALLCISAKCPVYAPLLRLGWGTMHGLILMWLANRLFFENFTEKFSNTK
jgi:hypothetical protein